MASSHWLNVNGDVRRVLAGILSRSGGDVSRDDIATMLMVGVCPRCSRTNLPDAHFCYFDGVSLFGNGQAAQAHAQAAALVPTFPMPFVFTSGLTCKNFDEFAQGCVHHWDEAIDLLAKGFLQGFFGGLGRMDLVRTAQEAAAFPDRERGLELLLTRLPTQTFASPRLQVRPRTIDLGDLAVGHNGEFKLQLLSEGSRLIFGAISSDCKWLTVTDSSDSKLLQFRDRCEVAIKIRGQLVRASAVPLEGDLCIETNAGSIHVKVSARVAIQPFPDGALAGARTPRELAEKAKGSPKQAAALFEGGAVARWYQANGWTYPVQGPAANGVAAVQQYFEALGLSKPPKVTVLETSVRLQGKPGSQCLHQLQLRAEENRPVFAHATCQAPWLVVKPAVLHATLATIPIEVNVPPQPGQTLQTSVKIRANGNQQFDIPVTLAVEMSPGAHPTGELLPVATPFNASSGARRSSAWMHLLPVALLGLCLLGLVVNDALSDRTKKQQAVVSEEPQEEKHVVAKAQFKVAIQDEPDELPVVPVFRHKIVDEPEEHIKLPVKVEIKDEPGQNNGIAVGVPIAAAPLVSYRQRTPPVCFGISTTAAAGAARFKQLTYAADGETNKTLVRVAGKQAELGASSGRWTRQNRSLNGIPATPGAVSPAHSTWTWNNVAFHQILEVVPGQPVLTGGTSRGHLDAVLVRWVIENQGKIARSAALRFSLDTLIGSNDGVPFTVPGKSGLVSSFADFPHAHDVPDFIQALEFGNLKRPGTVAHLTLKTGGQIEPPSRVMLTSWQSSLADAWEFPIRHIGSDSAVVLYWPDKNLKPGETRTIGFSYGLGSVTVNDKLGVTLGGSFEPGQHFTVTAYVENPLAGQTLHLQLPSGLRRMDGDENQQVALGNAQGRNTTVVTWKVLVERTGEFRLKVVSSTGLSQAKTISILEGNTPTGGKLALDLVGSFEPGQTFQVLGKVNEPIAKQTLTLHLPSGLEAVKGKLTQPVPAPPARSSESIVTWHVRVKEAGKYRLSVSSSTGVTQAKTITIVQPERGEGLFQVLLNGDFTPGKIFTVSASAVKPAPDQRLTLALPAGLDRVDGKETQAVRPGEPTTWQVKIQKEGRYSIAVKSTTGVTQRKTLTIEPPADQAGRFTLDFEGDIWPGKEFRVKALVAGPVPEQTLTLVLPKGLQAIDGEPKRKVEMPASGTGTSTVTWVVRVLEPGRMPVRVESSTGLTRTKTIVLTEPGRALFGR